MDETLSLELMGEVHLPDFVAAVGGLEEMVQALSEELAEGGRLEWIVDDLRVGSALATLRGVGDERAVKRVVSAFESVGEALEGRQPIQYSERVVRGASRIAGLINGRITSVRFETARRDSVVTGPVPPQSVQEKLEYPLVEAWGAVVGRVQTLTNRGALRFTLYDTHFDRGVSCYLARSYPREKMKDVWGRRASVEGWVKREKETGRPLTIRRVRTIKVLPDPQPREWEDARGVLRFDPDTRPETVVRRLRDA